MKPLLPAFSLRDASGADVSFPRGRVTVIALVKEDCPTCGLAVPLLEAFLPRLRFAIDVLIVGQTQDGNATLVERHGLTCPMLDDSRLRFRSHTTSTWCRRCSSPMPDGRQMRRVEGFRSRGVAGARC